MTRADESRALLQTPAVSRYIFVCLGALVVLLVVLLQRGGRALCLVPVLLGLLGLVTRWRTAPLLLLLALAAYLTVFDVQDPEDYGLLTGYGSPPPVRLSHLLLCGAVLAYTAAHYRIQGLMVQLLPPEPRPSEGGPAGRSTPAPPRREGERRSADRVPAEEVWSLLLAAPLWALLAQVIWRWAPAYLPAELVAGVWRPELVQAVALTWLLALGLLITAGVLGYTGRRRMTPEQGLLVLQDVLWRETRREQRRANRWLAWARLRWWRKDRS